MIKRIIVFSICAIMISGVVFADTIPGGDVSGTWYHSNSPYYITGNVTVQNADTLTIEPGVDVISLGNYSFRGWGALTADGTAADSIRFLCQDTSLGWQGIRLSYRNHRLSYCAVRNSKASGIQFSAIGCTLSVNHCRITDNRATIGGGIRIWANSAALKINNSVIARNTAVWDSGGMGGGIYIYLNGYLKMDSCLVDSNHARIGLYSTQFMAQGGGICADAAGIGHLSIKNSAITNNLVDGANNSYWATGGAMFICHVTDTPAVIINCLIRGNRSNSHIVLTGPCSGIWWNGLTQDKLMISHCEISQNSNLGTNGAAGLHAYGPADVINCTFADNTGGTHIAAWNSTARTSVVNSIFAHDQWAILHWSGAPATTGGYNLFTGTCDSMLPGFGVIDRVNRNGDSCDCYYNLFQDPRFADTLNGDYHLTSSSPCIDAGDSTLPYDPDGTIADMGCYWFNQIGAEERPVIRNPAQSLFSGATVFRGPLQLPEGKACRVFDIMGRVVEPEKVKPGIYFIEIDGKMTNKVIKVR